MSNFNFKPQLREKLIKFGAKNLSDDELMAVLLRTGTAKNPILKLSKEITTVMDSNSPENWETALYKVNGMGTTKICMILAAMELGRRFFALGGRKISHPSDIAPYLHHYAMRKQETFLCVSLSGANEILNIRVVSIGILNRTIVHPREVFADPLMDRAAGIIVAHNHPSGYVEPSPEDVQLTRRLASAGQLLGINLLDHLILNEHGEYFSFIENDIDFQSVVNF